MAYAIIKIGSRQYRVREGERLLVDRLPGEGGSTFTPDVLMVGGDGAADLAPAAASVTAQVVDHPLGKKIRIGKYRPKNGYRRHNGYRSRLTQIEITSIAGAKKRRGSATVAGPDQSVEGTEES